MDIRYFESLVCVAELGSIARAAKAQNLTAAAVGQRIAILEDYYDTELLDRSSRSAVPTRACEELLPLAREIVLKFSEMESALNPDAMTGKFSLGAIPTALTGILPGAIRRLAKEAPQLTLEIQPGTSKTLFDEVKSRKLDGAIIALPPFDLPGSIQAEILREEPLSLLAKKGMGKSIREKLEKNPYIAFDSQSWSGGGAVRFLRDEKITVEFFYELDALEPIEKLVAEGMGVSLVPQWAELRIDARVVDCEVIENPKYQRKLAFVMRKDRFRPQIAEAIGKALSI